MDSVLTSSRTLEAVRTNRPFYRYGGHIEFDRFKEYYGMPSEHSVSLYGRFSGKKRQTRHNDLFSRSIFFSGSHNTPYIQLIQYGRRIDKKVYLRTLCLGGGLL